MIALKPLLARLSRTCRGALERAAERCLRLGNYAVEIEHLFLELAADRGSDFARALDRYEIDGTALATELERAIARYGTGNQQDPGVSSQLATAVETGWGIASIELGSGVIGSACLLRAAIEDARVRDGLIEAVPILARIPRQRLADDLAELSAEMRAPGRDAAAGPPGAAASALEAYTVDLTAEARAERLDPVVGRDAEIDQAIEILMRRRQNNPILTGEAGVGKTAIVEGLAQRIAARSVPAALIGVAVRAVDIGLLQAGAGARGEFEQRLRGVIEEVQGAPADTILFIDEAHMLVGAGGAAGLADAANLLKPALARGGLRTIAATTWAEYKRYFEKDAALARRFQPVKVDPPGVDTSVVILRRLALRLEAHHGVRIGEDALAAAAAMSQRYIPDRQLPDKAIGVLDTACARVAIAQACRPQALDAADAALAAIEAESARIAADPAPGADAEERIEQLQRERAEAADARDAIASRWEAERYTFDRIRTLEREAGGKRNPELEGLHLELAELQQDAPLIPVAVDRRAVADVVSAWTGIPAGAILGTTAKSGDLRALLGQRIVGQDHALETIARRIQTFQAGLGDPAKPTGVFMLCGPSGVGKTETALALAELLFGGARALITVNMSEYQEAHSVSGLKGAPPGYVGYGKGGVLTEAVRRQPYSVVLLDEVEKAHRDVLELFYHVFDRGVIEDSEGVAVDFTHTLILLTSNLGTDLLANATRRSDPGLMRALDAELRGHFAPAFLGRLVAVPYFGLGSEQIRAIVRLKLARIGERFSLARRGELTYDDGVINVIAAQAEANDGGARSIDAILAHQILPELSRRLLDRLAEGGGARDAHISAAGAGRLRIEIER